MKTCYFTATGNSLYVARRIGGELLSIPQLMKRDRIELSDDAIGIVCPVYCGEMPKMVRAFLEKADIRTEYFFFVYTYGMSETVARPNAMAAKAKARLSYVNAVRMVDNYLPGFEMRDQMDTAGEKQIDAHIDAVCRDIAERRISVPAVKLGQRIGMALIHGTMGRAILKGTAARDYIVNDNCIRCGICAKVCPANNIAVTRESVAFSDRCEVCYACLHNCPKNAIHLKNEKSSVRFRNEHVSVRDIADANQ